MRVFVLAVLCLTIPCAGYAFADDSEDVIFAYARDVTNGAIEIPRPGTYQVWAWGPPDAEISVSWGGSTHLRRVENQEGSSEPFQWIALGEVAVTDEGSPEIRLSANVAAIALAHESVSNFDPNAAWGLSRVLAEPVAVDDARVGRVRHTDTVYTMPEFESVAAWEDYAEELRRRVLISSGLYPLPERTPLNAEVFGRVQLDDYSVEKVRIEAWPGFFVTGNLYRPVGPGPFPGVLMPHGHWAEGRLENGERGSVPARAITFARMGAVAFTIDMVGYNDSCQLGHSWSDSVKKLWGIHPFALQLWGGIRSLDFLESLPDVDPERLGCTGASGGGTQTFSLMAVDPRVKVAAPVNMISSTMQGGCVCENAPILRLHNSNMEIGALMAPRPLLMVSATGDWTRETPRVEFPAIRSVYALYGAEHRIANVHVDSPHNYNLQSREAVYPFFGKWLIDETRDWSDFSEPPYALESMDDLRLYPDGVPPAGSASEEEVIETVRAAIEAKWAAVLPQSRDDRIEFALRFGDVLETVLGARVPGANDLSSERMRMERRDDIIVEAWIIGRRGAGDRIPAILYRNNEPGQQDAVLVVDGAGKEGLVDWVLGGPDKRVRDLLENRKAVLVIDPFLTGEYHSPWHETERRVVGTFGDTFQPTTTGYRVQDILTGLAFLRARRDISDQIDLIGLGDAGVWSLMASAIDGRVDRTIVDMNGFDAGSDSAWVDEHYIPCIRSVGGLDTAGALIAPRSLWLTNTQGVFDTTAIEAAYSGGDEASIRVTASQPSGDANLGYLR